MGGGDAGRPRLVLVPGLGTDGRLLEPQRSLPARVDVLDWLEPEDKDEPLPRYAGRLAERVAEGARDGEVLFVGGVSLGAMLALEMARHLEKTPVGCRGVFVIGGARCGADINPVARKATHLLNPLQPWFVRLMLPAAGWVAQFGQGLDKDQRRLMRRMLKDMPVGLLKWQCNAALGWELAEPPAAPVHAIHGEDDPVVQRDRHEADEVVPGGKHLINLTHADRVNRFIADRLAGV